MLIKLSIETEMHYSEDKQIIEDAISRIYNFEEFETVISEKEEESGLKIIRAQAEGIHTLSNLFTMVREQQIVESVRNHVLNRVYPKRTKVKFALHKQALTRGRISLVSFPGESPLGPIIITIESGSTIQLTKLVEWLFPRTDKGKVIEVKYTIEDEEKND